jgi:nitrite reductase/ring-hydroxylating ferredoxin subunit
VQQFVLIKRRPFAEYMSAESSVPPEAPLPPQPHLWCKVAAHGIPADGSRIHAKVDGRYVTVFRHRGKLSCIDSICHHAGGPLTLGRLQDIEDLGVTVVLCPWHAFMVTIDGGLKAYKAVDFRSGKPADAGWKIGKVVQRPHLVVEKEDGVYVVGLATWTVGENMYLFSCFVLPRVQSLQITEERCSSDNDAYSALCAQDYPICAEVTSTECPHH